MGFGYNHSGELRSRLAPPHRRKHPRTALTGDDGLAANHSWIIGLHFRSVKAAEVVEKVEKAPIGLQSAPLFTLLWGQQFRHIDFLPPPPEPTGD
jgi:hypothetical protein